MKGSELFGYLEKGDKESMEKAVALEKKLNSEIHARGELLPKNLQNYKIGEHPEDWPKEIER
jgi:hypothetical protein